jgi:hypothetical protein
VALALLGDATAAPRMRETAVYGRAVENSDPDGALVVAALGVLDAPAAAAVAREYLPPLLNARREDPTAMIAFALARAEDGEALTQLARSPMAKLRASTARGIALCARTRQGSMAAMSVIEDLRFDPDPAVRAEIAVARGLLNFEGAAKDICAALTGPDELLGVTYGPATPYDVRSGLAYLAGADDLPNLRAALWSAWDACTPGQGPEFRPEMGRGRQRELVRQARAAQSR